MQGGDHIDRVLVELIDGDRVDPLPGQPVGKLIRDLAAGQCCPRPDRGQVERRGGAGKPLHRGLCGREAGVATRGPHQHRHSTSPEAVRQQRLRRSGLIVGRVHAKVVAHTGREVSLRLSHERAWCFLGETNE